MCIDNNKSTVQHFKGMEKLVQPLSTFYDANVVIPTLAIETGVTLGRTQQANKRGGKVEAMERFVEQGVSALVWIFGVQAIKNTNEFLAKKLFNIKNLNFDVGSDELRNPIKNNKISPKIAGFKAGNILFSTAVATLFIGFVLPKINHFITNKALKNDKNKENEKEVKNTKEDKTPTLLKPVSIDLFKEQVKKNNKINFGSAALALAHTLENNSTARLLITDTGVISGRCYNGRNKYERIENFFRDTASVYFYLFSAKNFVWAMNKLTNNTDINPLALKEEIEFLKQKVNEKPMSAKDFVNNAIGNISDENSAKLEELFKDKEVINLEAFLERFPQYNTKANKMSELQPIFDNKRFLSKRQAKDVLSNGWLCEPEFLKRTMNKATKGASDNPLKYVKKKELEQIRSSLDGFILQVAKSAKDNQIDSKFIEKTANKNMLKNFVYQLGGLGVAAFCLGILIPKVQYAITKHLTKQNEFPGTKKYDE